MVQPRFITPVVATSHEMRFFTHSAGAEAAMD
jgi:hypothetical protein